VTRQRESGFTLVEIAIVIVLLTTMLAAVWNTANAVGSTVDTNSRSAEVTSSVRSTLRRIGAFARSAKMTTLLVQAVQEDVTAGRATAIGEWIPPPDPDLLWRPGIQFQMASGLLSMNAALSTSPRRLTFEIEPGETQNGVDDDGDGLIDEGEVRLVHDMVTIAVVRNIETCEFQLDGRMLRVRIASGRRDRSSTVIRAQLEQSFYLRNN